MEQIKQVSQLRQTVDQLVKSGKKIVLVPTMGNLHAGHLSLVEEAQKHGDCVVVSIFVNPAQFNNPQDLQNYPRTLEDDLAKLQRLNISKLLVFTPNVDDIYPRNLKSPTWVKESSIANNLCGASRAGHFDGVVTVVLKLFNLVTPNVAIFGRKDFQQLQVIKALVADLFLPIKIIGIPCVRESSGLALSSRNNLLDAEQKKIASSLYQVLLACADQIKNGANDFGCLERQAKESLQNQGFKVDYFKICSAKTLETANSAQDRNLLIAVAVFLADVRLIDNIEINL